MGNVVYGTGLSLKQLSQHLENFYLLDLPLSSQHTFELKQLLLNLTSYSKFIHELFTHMSLRDMFSLSKREQTKALVRFCIDTMYEVAVYDY